MNKNYVKPLVEMIEIEMQSMIAATTLGASDGKEINTVSSDDGGDAWAEGMGKAVDLGLLEGED